jgi:hypothetical protein
MSVGNVGRKVITEPINWILPLRVVNSFAKEYQIENHVVMRDPHTIRVSRSGFSLEMHDCANTVRL